MIEGSPRNLTNFITVAGEDVLRTGKQNEKKRKSEAESKTTSVSIVDLHRENESVRLPVLYLLTDVFIFLISHN